VPAAGLRGVFGQMADETVLVSAKVVPGKLAATGYVFRWPQLAGALRHVLGLNG
jgi:NAD dependent epimerase/dehydratase family enzyme